MKDPVTQFKLTWKQTIPQPNGFVLVKFEQTPYKELPINFEFKWQGETLVLFQQQSSSVSFLALGSTLKAEGSDDELIELMSKQSENAWLWQNWLTQWDSERPLLLIAENLKIASLLGIAKRYQTEAKAPILAVLYSDNQFPFKIQPALQIWPNFPSEAIGACPLLEDWGIPNRLCHSDFRPGCFQGSLTDLWQNYPIPKDWQVCIL